MAVRECVGDGLGGAEREAGFRQALHAPLFIELLRVGYLATANRIEIRALVGEGAGDSKLASRVGQALHALAFIEFRRVGHDCSFLHQGPTVQPDLGSYGI